VTNLLGEPGPFADPARKSELTVAPAEFASFATAYVESGRAPGMHPLEVACESLLASLRERLAPGLTLFVTHDFFAAGLLAFLGLKRPTRTDWADYLEGVCFVLDPGGRFNPFRFVGLEEIRAC
jgi:hypothetical protein